jgi:hypothetical protein
MISMWYGPDEDDYINDNNKKFENFVSHQIQLIIIWCSTLDDLIHAPYIHKRLIKIGNRK